MAALEIAVVRVALELTGNEKYSHRHLEYSVNKSQIISEPSFEKQFNQQRTKKAILKCLKRLTWGVFKRILDHSESRGLKTHEKIGCRLG